MVSLAGAHGYGGCQDHRGPVFATANRGLMRRDHLHVRVSFMTLEHFLNFFFCFLIPTPVSQRSVGYVRTSYMHASHGCVQKKNSQASGGSVQLLESKRPLRVPSAETAPRPERGRGRGRGGAGVDGMPSHQPSVGHGPLQRQVSVPGSKRK